MEKIKDIKYKIGTIIKHLKRGSIYEIINVGYIESTLTPAYSYRCLSDDVIWYRPITEVEDTDRFIKMETAIIFMNTESKSGITVFDNDKVTPIGIVRSVSSKGSKIELFDEHIINKINNGTKHSYSMGCKGV